MISKPEIIALAACSACGAMRGEPCTFIRAARAVAGQSHFPRVTLARKIHAENRQKALAPDTINM